MKNCQKMIVDGSRLVLNLLVLLKTVKVMIEDIRKTIKWYLGHEEWMKL